VINTVIYVERCTYSTVGLRTADEKTSVSVLCFVFVFCDPSDKLSKVSVSEATTVYLLPTMYSFDQDNMLRNVYA